MRLITALFATLLAFTPLAAHAAEAPAHESAYDRVMRTGTLRCGYIVWPPGFEKDANTGEVSGPGKELSEAIIRLAGWQAEFVEVTLGNVPLDLENGRIDAMCIDGPWTISNVRLVDYTSWVYYTPVFVYVRANETRFHTYRDMNNVESNFIGIDGDISVDLAALRFPQAKLQTLINLTDPAQMLLNVADGKADAVVLDPVTADSFMKNNPGKVRELKGNGPLAVYPVGMSVRRGEAQLQQTLSRATEMAINIGLVDDKLDLYDPTRRSIYAVSRPYQIPSGE